MKCSDCKRYRTKECYANPSGEDHESAEQLTCFVPKDFKGTEQDHVAQPKGRLQGEGKAPQPTAESSGTLTPEEKRRIYEEEKVRLEAKEDKKKSEEKNMRTGCLGLIVIIAVVVIAIVVGVTVCAVSQVNLDASVEFDGAQFTVTNYDSFDWTNVKLEVNGPGGYVLNTPKMLAGETYTVGALQFAKSDGTRLNPFTTKVQEISIECDTPKGHGLYLGKWD